MERIAVVDGIRTPFCKMGTHFNEMRAQDLGQIVTRELLERTGLDANLIDEVIFGCVGMMLHSTQKAIHSEHKFPTAVCSEDSHWHLKD